MTYLLDFLVCICLNCVLDTRIFFFNSVWSPSKIRFSTMILKYFEIISWYHHHTNSISFKILKHTPSAVDTICFFLLETSLSCYELKTRIWKPEIERCICHSLLKTSIRCNDDRVPKLPETVEISSKFYKISNM